jgi:hypothetical protein
LVLAAISSVAAADLLPAAAQGRIGSCRIADPTGTPLNVRRGPQGQIIGTLRNGSIVHVSATARDHKGQVWAQIVDGEGRRTIGWVLRAYMSCF